MFKGYIQFLQGFDHFGGVRRYPAKAKSHKDIYLLHQTSPPAPFEGGEKLQASPRTSSMGVKSSDGYPGSIQRVFVP